MKSIIALILAAVAAATPTALINATTSGLDKPNGGSQLITAQLNQLNTYPGLTVTKLQLVSGQGDLDPASVECRMYKDTTGLTPGSLPFSGDTVAYISTNTVTVGSILCYAIKNVA